MASKWTKDPVTGKFVNTPVVPTDQRPANAVTTEKDPNNQYCEECDKVIDGRMIRALDTNWHADCFACATCSRQFEMNTLGYTVDGGRAYCRQCITSLDEQRGDGIVVDRPFYDAASCLSGDPTYVETRVVFGQKQYGGGDGGGTKPLADVMTDKGPVAAESKEACTGCGGAIQGMSVGTKRGVYHEQCFKCGHCHDLIAAESFEFNGATPMHVDCYKKATAPPCGRCGQPAYGKTYNVKGVRYHLQCYTCAACNKSLEAGHLSNDAGELFCSGACKKAGTGASPAPVPAAAVAPAAPIPAAAATGNKFCVECGSPNPQQFCGNCGAMQA